MNEKLLEDILDKLSKIYAYDPYLFLHYFSLLPYETIQYFRFVEFKKDKSDIEDYSTEIYINFHITLTEYQRELYPARVKVLALRNFYDQQEYINILHKLRYIAEYNTDVFLDIFPRMPINLWDKIDELREVSFKSKNSIEFRECLLKSKSVSFIYSDLVDPIVKGANNY